MDLSTYNCGAYWSDGRLQSSVCDFENVPVDSFDESCRVHDRDTCRSASYLDLLAADDKFFEINKHFKGKRKVAAYLVKYQDNMLPLLGGMLAGLLGHSLASTYVFNRKYLAKNSPATPASQDTPIMRDPVEFDDGLCYNPEPQIHQPQTLSLDFANSLNSESTVYTPMGFDVTSIVHDIPLMRKKRRRRRV
jgi:hypothetical protein